MNPGDVINLTPGSCGPPTASPSLAAGEVLLSASERIEILKIAAQQPAVTNMKAGELHNDNIPERYRNLCGLVMGSPRVASESKHENDSRVLFSKRKALADRVKRWCEGNNIDPSEPINTISALDAFRLLGS